MSTKSQSATAEKPAIGRTLDELEKSLKDEASAEATARADQLKAMLRDYLRMLISPPDVTALHDLARELQVDIAGIKADAEALRQLQKYRAILATKDAARAAVPVARAARDAARVAMTAADRAYVQADGKFQRAVQAGSALMRIAMQRPGFFANPAEPDAAKLRLITE